MRYLPARSEVCALTGSGIEWLAAKQAGFYADGGGCTQNTRIRQQHPPRRGLPGFDCAMAAVKRRAGPRPIRVLSVYPFCICVESFLLCRVPHRCRAGEKPGVASGLGDVPHGACGFVTAARSLFWWGPFSRCMGPAFGRRVRGAARIVAWGLDRCCHKPAEPQGESCDGSVAIRSGVWGSAPAPQSFAGRGTCCEARGLLPGALSVARRVARGASAPGLPGRNQGSAPARVAAIEPRTLRLRRR